MISTEPGASKKENGDRDLNLDHMFRFKLYVNRLLEEFQSSINVLPKVDNSGHSDCPFAVDLYDKKEECADRVTEMVGDLEGYIRLVNKEIARFSENLRQVRKDINSIYRPSNKEKYRQAEKNYQYHYSKNIKLKEELVSLKALANQKLKKAAEKKWPKGASRPKPYYPPTGSNIVSKLVSSLQTPPSATGLGSGLPSMANTGNRPAFTSGLNDLIDLGPIHGFIKK